MNRSVFGGRTSVVKVGAVLAFAATTLLGCGSDDSASNDTASGDSQGAGCTPQDGDFDTLQDGVLTVATVEYPPYTWVNDGQVAGSLDGDVVTEFAKRNCLEIEAKAYDYPAVIQLVQDGRVDVSGTTAEINAEREAILNFSSPLWLSAMSTVTEEEGQFTTVASMKGKRIGDLQGTNFEGLAEAIGSGYTSYPDNQSMVADIQNGRLDGGIGFTAAVASTYNGLANTKLDCDESVPATCNPLINGFMMSKDNPEIRDAFNRFLEAAKNDGTLEEIAQRYELPTSAYAFEDNQ